MRWEFTPDEFMHVWRETGADRFPFPLRLIASVRWEDEFDALTRHLDDRLPRHGDPDLSAALRVAADPETSLSLIGTRRKPMRAYGAIDTDIGVTMVQRPGPTTEFGGNVVIQAGRAALVAKVFTAVAGDVPAGRHRALSEDLDRLQLGIDSWTGSKETAADRILRLLRAPRSGSGTIESLPNVRGHRPPEPRYLNWFDIEGDGRYLYRKQFNEFHLTPCDQSAILREITQLTPATR
ncbi:ESX secretion-associated protein EspG [Nocardia puris]|uniref:ESAT-6 protein secretion system EspG family protein n=1 Tax=Nocardia puris TaxID=208602 RepID=A0A366DW06_9NOCA|nr:ESX secretion-associated protein EspG [Nocardia puris]RBO94266.1 ESAT-6 protein secretion system EspG family protein [Nocardia puris]